MQIGGICDRIIARAKDAPIHLTHLGALSQSCQKIVDKRDEGALTGSPYPLFNIAGIVCHPQMKFLVQIGARQLERLNQ